MELKQILSIKRLGREINKRTYAGVAETFITFVLISIGFLGKSSLDGIFIEARLGKLQAAVDEHSMQLEALETVPENINRIHEDIVEIKESNTKIENYYIQFINTLISK